MTKSSDLGGEHAYTGPPEGLRVKKKTSQNSNNGANTTVRRAIRAITRRNQPSDSGSPRASSRLYGRRAPVGARDINAAGRSRQCLHAAPTLEGHDARRPRPAGDRCLRQGRRPSALAAAERQQERDGRGSPRPGRRTGGDGYCLGRRVPGRRGSAAGASRSPSLLAVAAGVWLSPISASPPAPPPPSPSATRGANHLLTCLGTFRTLGSEM
jgi:hypothetical protein